MNARMAPAEAERLAQMYRAMPQSGFYPLVSEYTGKTRNVKHEDAVYVLTVRGLIGTVAA